MLDDLAWRDSNAAPAEDPPSWTVVALRFCLILLLFSPVLAILIGGLVFADSLGFAAGR